MRKLILIAALISLTGCGAFKKVFKNKSLDKVESNTKFERNTDSLKVVVDKSEITIKETVSDSVSVPGRKIQVDTPLDLDLLKEGLTIIKDEGIHISQTLDSTGKKITTLVTIPERKVPVYKQKETRIKKDSTSTERRQDAVKDERQERTVSRKLVVQKDPKNYFWLVALILAIIAGLAWVVKKFYLRR